MKIIVNVKQGVRGANVTQTRVPNYDVFDYGVHVFVVVIDKTNHPVVNVVLAKTDMMKIIARKNFRTMIAGEKELGRNRIKSHKNRPTQNQIRIPTRKCQINLR